MRTWRKVKFWRRFSSSSELRVRVDRLLVTLRRGHTHDTHKILTLFCFVSARFMDLYVLSYAELRLAGEPFRMDAKSS